MGKLTINVTGLSTKGAANVQFAIYDEKTFLKVDIPPFNKIIKSDNYEMVSAYFDLPEGEYAVAVFQDLNEDGKMNANFFGIPTDPYGFSLNYKPLFRGPKFYECSFLIEKNENKTLNIKLIK